MPIVKRTTTAGTTRYYGSVDVGTGPDGKRHRRGVGGFATKREAERAVREAQRALDRHEYVARTAVTLTDYVELVWLPEIRAERKATTAASYEAQMRTHVLPDLGAIKLQAITAQHVRALLQRLQRSGRLDRRGGLSPRSVAYVRTLVHAVLRHAVDDGVLARNVADSVRMPAPPAGQHEPEEPRIRAWTREQLDAFLVATQGHHHWPAWRLAAATGMRRGEILGLRWGEVDLDAPSVRVVRSVVSVGGRAVVTTPKSAKGVRTISVGPAVATMLRQHRATLRDLSIGLASDGGLVFPRLVPAPGGRRRPDLEPGQPQTPAAFSSAFDRAVASARPAVPRISFHGLRHTNASLLLEAGEQVHVVSQRLGHAGPAITLQVYAHVLQGQDERAAAVLDDVAGLG